MLKTVRSARGAVVDFQLLAIKSQLAAKPAPKEVIERKAFIEERDGVKAKNSIPTTPEEIISAPKTK